MIIGILKEIKTEEFRVGVTPSGVRELRRDGHTVLVEPGAGSGSGFSDDDYRKADADLLGRETIFKKSELIVKVKEPLQEEYNLLEEDRAIFTYLHLAPNRELTEVLLRKKMTALGYETLEKDGTLPLLSPMSEIAGRMAPLMGAYYLQKFKGGSGILATGASGRVFTFPGNISSIFRSLSAPLFMTMVSIPRPTATRAAFVPTTPAPSMRILPGLTPLAPVARIPEPPLNFWR